MIYQKFETNSYCVVGAHQSATISVESDVTKTGQKLLIGKCVHRNWKKSLLFSDNTIAAVELSSCEKKGKPSAKPGKKLATNLMKNPGRALEIGTKIASAAIGRNIKETVSTIPDVITFISDW